MSESDWLQTRDRLLESTTQIAWDQWRTLGASVTAVRAEKTLVDPEALVLISLALAAHEPRLTEVVESWVSQNAALLSVQRLRNLRRAYPPAVAEAVAALVQRTRDVVRHPRWKSLGDAAPTLPDLSLASAGDRGASRPRSARVREVAPAARAIETPVMRSANLMLRLRLGFGVGTKADVLALTLAHRTALSARVLADLSGYTTVGIRAAMEDLARAGFVHATGRRPYAVVAADGWESLLQLAPRPTYRHWQGLFALAARVTATIDEGHGKGLADYALAVQVREQIEARASTLDRAWDFLVSAPAGLELGAALRERLCAAFVAAREAV